MILCDYDNIRMWHHRVIKVFTQEGLDAASVKIPKWVGEWEFHFQEIDRVHIELPEHWEFPEPPEALAVESEFGRLSFHAVSGESGWDLERDLAVETLAVPLESYDEAREFLDRSLKVLSTPLVLERVDR
jgi:hypothetical protein